MAFYGDEFEIRDATNEQLLTAPITPDPLAR